MAQIMMSYDWAYRTGQIAGQKTVYTYNRPIKNDGNYRDTGLPATVPISATAERRGMDLAPGPLL